MAKRIKLVDPTLSYSVGTLHSFCQQNTTEKVQFHIQPKGEQDEATPAGYKTLTENLLEFNHLGPLPRTINIHTLDEGRGVEAAFIAHIACNCWHRSCRLTYNNTKLERASKLSKDIPADDAGEDSSGVSKCIKSSSISQYFCFSCGRSSVSRVCFYKHTCEMDHSPLARHARPSYDTPRSVGRIPSWHVHSAKD